MDPSNRDGAAQRLIDCLQSGDLKNAGARFDELVAIIGPIPRDGEFEISELELHAFRMMATVMSHAFPSVWNHVLLLVEMKHEANPDSASACCLIEAKRMGGRHESAAAFATTAMAEFPDDWSLMLQAAATYAVVDREPEARTLVARAIALHAPSREFLEKQPTLFPLRGL